MQEEESRTQKTNTATQSNKETTVQTILGLLNQNSKLDLYDLYKIIKATNNPDYKNLCDKNRIPLSIVALRSGQMSAALTLLLIGYPESINATDTQGNSFLMVALSHFDKLEMTIKETEELLKMGANPHHENNNEENVLAITQERANNMLFLKVLDYIDKKTIQPCETNSTYIFLKRNILDHVENKYKTSTTQNSTQSNHSDRHLSRYENARESGLLTLVKFGAEDELEKFLKEHAKELSSRAFTTAKFYANLNNRGRLLELLNHHWEISRPVDQDRTRKQPVTEMKPPPSDQHPESPTKKTKETHNNNFSYLRYHDYLAKLANETEIELFSLVGKVRNKELLEEFLNSHKFNRIPLSVLKKAKAAATKANDFNLIEPINAYIGEIYPDVVSISIENLQKTTTPTLFQITFKTAGPQLTKHKKIFSEAVKNNQNKVEKDISMTESHKATIEYIRNNLASNPDKEKMQEESLPFILYVNELSFYERVDQGNETGIIECLEIDPNLQEIKLATKSGLQAPLFTYAVLQGYSELVTFLLNKNPELVDQIDEFGNTPLMTAVFATPGKGDENYFSIAMCLLENGADANCSGHAFLYSEKKESTESVKAQESESFFTLIHGKFSKKQITRIITIIKEKSSTPENHKAIDEKIKDAKSSWQQKLNDQLLALLKTPGKKNNDILLDVIELVTAGADIHVKDHDETPAIILAARNHHPALVSYFLEKNPELVNACDSGKNSLLMVVIENYKKQEFATCLLALGANLEHGNEAGNNAFTTAWDTGDLTLINMITNFSSLSSEDKNQSRKEALRRIRKGNQEYLKRIEKQAQDQDQSTLNPNSLWANRGPEPGTPTQQPAPRSGKLSSL